MSDCQYIALCTFFEDKMSSMPATANVFKRQFCQGIPENCARHMVWKAKGKESVPASLFPNERLKATQIVGQYASVNF